VTSVRVAGPRDRCSTIEMALSTVCDTRTS
jgi:hypothetical protein